MAYSEIPLLSANALIRAISIKLRVSFGISKPV